MTTICWIVAIERYGQPGGGGGLDVNAPIGKLALELAISIATRDPTARLILSLSLPETPSYAELRAGLPPTVMQTSATQQDLQDALLHLEGDGTLFLYWVGHGIMSTHRRLLLCADSRSVSDLRGIDVDSLLTRFRSSVFPRTQLGFFDACAQVIPAPTVVNLGGEGNVPTAQYFYFAASAAEVAAADIASERGFARTIVRTLSDPERPFPPEPRPLFAELERRFDEAQLSTRAFPLQWTNGSGGVWSRKDTTADTELLPYAIAAHATLGEFEHLHRAAAGCVADQALSDALRGNTMQTLLQSQPLEVAPTMRVQVSVLQDAWCRFVLARQLEAHCLRLGLPWSEWQNLSRKICAQDNLQEATPPDSLIGVLLSVLDQARPERGIDSCIRLLALASRGIRSRYRQRADTFESAVSLLPELAARWAGAVASLPRLDGPIFLVIALHGPPEAQTWSVVESWMYRCYERDRTWHGKPQTGPLVEQINELIQRAKNDNDEGRLIVELAMPSDLICSPRELLELVDNDLDTVTWLEAGSAVILRWQDRMRGAARYQPGTWKQQTKVAETRLDDDPRLDVAWLDEPALCPIVGVPFPGPSGSCTKRNRKAFFEALLKGDPWMCWPRTEHPDTQTFKKRVRDFVRKHSPDPTYRMAALIEALRRERERDQDSSLCSLWLFIDDPQRNPFEGPRLQETTQRGLP